MSFLGGLFTGNNPTETGDVGNAGQIMGFGTAAGEGAVQTGLGFEEGLLSGNQAQIGQLLAPEISNIQKEGQQQIQTAGQFQNRSGGTNASAQNNIDTQRAAVNDMISKLTGQAAGAVTNTGENLLNTGLKANQVQNQEAQQIMDNQANSIFGMGTAEGAGAIEGLALGKL
jgi:hypothetical protein